MSLCKDCVTGVTHEGEPTGTIEQINGVKTYVALPPAGKYETSKAVLFLPDVFGLELVNARLLADDFAKNGYQTYIPDYLNSDPITSLDGSVDFQAWFANHGPEQTRPSLDKVIAGLKERGIKEFGATGYCFGARYVFDLAFDNGIKVGVVSHPSLLKVPEDLEKFKATGVPLLINSCEVDQMYPPESQKIGDDILGGGKTETEKYKREYFAGCVHGFAVRGDLSKPEVKAGKEGSFLNAIQWFHKFL
ncbi:alpha/beta-hydrolase [Fomitiporia mediterranea MF3/22]|uniref:alpha/beta-hydrolase n=1 Tax=Fomitiporia mediterranea (strain MF3/22) TaxID=694068 RepID=UPI0004409023|nr:alpha/beta-hydrolase [Fomitiporia mediterranea MF3/22]EJD07441.1 alpha/beta-hydrolase [Fomitiporia mediterranea MF3/22]